MSSPDAGTRAKQRHLPLQRCHGGIPEHVRPSRVGWTHRTNWNGVRTRREPLCRRARERQVAELVQAQLAAIDLNELPVSVDSLRTAAMKLVGKTVLKLASEKPEEVEQLASFTKLLLESEGNDLRRARSARR